MNSYELGVWGENKVAEMLIHDLGCSILERNYRALRNEIDIFFWDDDELVFGEVKTRANTKYIKPREAVNFSKRRKIKNVARHYIIENNLVGNYVRFDVFEVCFKYNKIIHIKNAY